MRILQIYTYYPPENVASTHLKKNLTQAYIDAGFSIDVVAPSPTRGIDDATYEKYKDLKLESTHNGKVMVHRFKMRREKRNLLLRTLRYLHVNLMQYAEGKKYKDADVISSGSTPPTQGLVCARLKKKLGIPFVYNLQDIFPDSLVSSGLVRKGSLLWKIGRRIENNIYIAADKIIVISDDHKQNIKDKGVPEEKIVVIPNWVNVDNVYPVKREENVLVERFGLDPNLFYIVYSGNIGLSQNFEHLLAVAQILQKELDDVRFVIIGEGVEKEHLISEIKSRSLTNIYVFPFQPYEDIASVFSLGDAGLIISKSGVGANSVPSKTWGIMAAERPILASFDRESNLVKLIDESGCGLTSSPDDVTTMVENIKTLYGDFNERVKMGLKAKKYLEKYNNKEKCVSMYVRTLKSLIKNVGEH